MLFRSAKPPNTNIESFIGDDLFQLEVTYKAQAQDSCCEQIRYRRIIVAYGLSRNRLSDGQLDRNS